jgi:acetyl/propionyl-CoA carboxylase alpha subunit
MKESLIVIAGKHIEFQIFGDSSGACISLFERECSIQRRHQKVIEEAPSPYMTPDLRARMAAAATELGRLLNYEGAGTVEFIVDAKSGRFYFLEVNTRVQVEHPITEETTLVDIVALQIYVASGGLLKDLPYLRDLRQQGHAIELRLCAEDPWNNFLPCTGTIRRFSTIHDLTGTRVTHVRYETGVETSSQVSVYFDPMIAKIVVWAPDRHSAIRLAKRVLANTTVLGLGTNQEFLGRCLSHPGFLDKNYTTRFIEQYREDLFREEGLEDLERTAVETSMFLKYCADVERSAAGKLGQSAFNSIPSKFRVQTMDRTNVKADHITLAGKSFLVQYLPQRNGDGDTVQVWPVPTTNPLPSEGKKFLNKIGGALVARYYQAMTPPESGVRTFDVSIVHAALRRRGRVLEEWIEGDVAFQVDGSIKTVFVATEGDWRSRDDLSQTVWVHVPDLCAGIKSIRRNLLTFAGRLDERASGASSELGMFSLLS